MVKRELSSQDWTECEHYCRRGHDSSQADENYLVSQFNDSTGEILALKRHLGLVNVDDYQKATACRYIKESGNYTQVGLTVMNSVGEIVGTPMEKKIRV